MSAPPPLALTVVVDFNETLVRERTLAAWCRERMRRGPWRRRLGAAARAGFYGTLAVLADLLGREALAARLGFRVLEGVRRAEIEDWAGQALTLNPKATAALERLADESGALALVVVSRGTPQLAVRAWFFRRDVRALLARARVESFPLILAPELEESLGVLTGRVTGDIPSKSERARLGPHGAVFLGDRRDWRWARRLKDRHFRFVRADL